jgi:hypothetical protein
VVAPSSTPHLRSQTYAPPCVFPHTCFVDPGWSVSYRGWCHCNARPNVTTQSMTSHSHASTSQFVGPSPSPDQLSEGTNVGVNLVPTDLINLYQGGSFVIRAAPYSHVITGKCMSPVGWSINMLCNLSESMM